MTQRQKTELVNEFKLFPPCMDGREELLEHTRTKLESKVLQRDFKQFDVIRLHEIYREEKMMSWRHVQMI